jgi:hypothetical protein
MNNTGNYEDFTNTDNTKTNNRTTQEIPEPLNTGIGKLKIFVFTGNAALPINGAQITVYTKDSNNNKVILYQLVSNYDGEAEEITLETPDKDNSLSPYDQAFSIYYVNISHPDYNPADNIEVQIFPETITILPTNLQPRNEVIK